MLLTNSKLITNDGLSRWDEIFNTHRLCRGKYVDCRLLHFAWECQQRRNTNALAFRHSDLEGSTELRGGRLHRPMHRREEEQKKNCEKSVDIFHALKFLLGSHTKDRVTHHKCAASRACRSSCYAKCIPFQFNFAPKWNEPKPIMKLILFFSSV